MRGSTPVIAPTAPRLCVRAGRSPHRNKAPQRPSPASDCRLPPNPTRCSIDPQGTLLFHRSALQYTMALCSMQSAFSLSLGRHTRQKPSFCSAQANRTRELCPNSSSRSNEIRCVVVPRSEASVDQHRAVIAALSL